MHTSKLVRLRPYRAGSIIISIALALGLFVATPAAAAEPDQDIRGNGTGGGWVVGKRQMHLTAQERTDIAAKQRLWDAYSARLAGDLSDGEYKAIEQRTEQTLGIGLNGPIPAARAGGCPPPPAPCPSTKTLLPVRHASQGTTFTCGSTTGYMIARYAGKKRSRFNRARLTGKNMGGRKHMRTYVNRSTPWASKNFKRGLNRWMKGRSRGYYQQHANPNAKRVKKALRYNIDHGHPFAASTLELAGRDHYNGHPSSIDIGHWLAVRGYDKNLRRINFLDPAAKSPALPTYDSKKRFERKTKRFTRKFMGPGHGIAA